jgi:hypothetical protein
LFNLNISYINPPASFEPLGQKVRLPRDIMNAKMGTCLDLTYFECSLLERAGLNPVLFAIKGHAFYGYWRAPLCNVEGGATVELGPILEMIDKKKLLVAVNSTSGVAGRPFEEAVATGRKYLSPDHFFWMVDIKAARGLGIRPLPY